MSAALSQSGLIAHRAELIAELFLQDLHPTFLARSETEKAFHFFAGFRNRSGGLNTIAVEIQGTHKPVGERFRIESRIYDRLAHSNLPVLLLVVDVKENEIFYTWPVPEKNGAKSPMKLIDVRKIDTEEQERLLERLTGEILDVQNMALTEDH